MVRQVKRCPCTEEDWECASGFKRNPTTNKCEPRNPKWIQTPPLFCQDYYRVKTGYRKASGNMCEGGLDLGPHNMTCPNLQQKGIIYISIALLLLFCLAIRNR